VKIAIIGNSNSIMKSSYADFLRANGNKVDNFSIGGSPNIVALETALTTNLRGYDYIIVETAVVDALHGPSGIYPADIALRNLRLGLQSIQSVSRARIILLLLPTRIGLLEPKTQTSEAIHLQVADELRIPVLNVFHLFRTWIGGYDPVRIQKLSAWAPIVAEAFGVPRPAAYDLSWSALRRENSSANLFALAGFLDQPHVTRAVHLLISRILCAWMAQEQATMADGCGSEDPLPGLLINPDPANYPHTIRESALMRRSLVQLSDGDSITFRCPPEYLVVGILFNRCKTSGYAAIRSEAGTVLLNCHFFKYPSSWIAVLVPIIDRIGGGDITLTMRRDVDPDLPYRKLADTNDGLADGVAEVGEMIAIRRDRASDSYVSRSTGGIIDIAGSDWVEKLCADAHQSMADTMEGLSPMSLNACKGLAPLLLDHVRDGRGHPLPRDRAKTLLLLGLPRAALQLISEAVAEDNDDLALAGIKHKLESFIANSSVQAAG
jgi:hypothetical protein